MVHESDEATLAKFTELQAMESTLSNYQRNIRICQRDLRRLDMIATSQRNEDGTSEIIYTLPNNTAGNEIDPDYRLSQKDELIVNVDKLLDELKGFLP